MVKSDILLEAGTNELEMLLFELPGAIYGVNVAKVREVILSQPPTPVPESKEVVEGVLNLRGRVLPIISLRKYFGLGECDNSEDQRIIVMEFSNVAAGFVVDAVDKIYRMGWHDLSPVPEEAIMKGAAFTAIAKVQDKIVLIIDFERIILEVSETDFKTHSEIVTERSERNRFHVLIADDSLTIRGMVIACMEKAGYQVTPVADGQHAWELVEEKAGEQDTQFDLIISDIEMPRMDGLHLTRKIKENAKTKNIPVVLYSSLISPNNLKKGKAVGADAQICKPNIHRLPQIVDGFLLGKSADAALHAVGTV